MGPGQHVPRQSCCWVQDLEQLLHAHGISSVGPHQVRWRGATRPGLHPPRAQACGLEAAHAWRAGFADFIFSSMCTHVRREPRVGTESLALLWQVLPNLWTLASAAASALPRPGM